MPDPRQLLEHEASAVNLRALAEQIVDARERRQWLFPRAAFGETAWELLLRLYTCESHVQSLESLTGATFASPPEAERWVRYLEAQDLVATGGDATNLSMLEVRLTQQAVSALDLYLAETQLRNQDSSRGAQEHLVLCLRHPAVWALAIALAAIASGITYALTRS